MAHSKRNTSRAVFTSHERTIAKAAWGASSARLTRESFLPFASCSLCLEAAVDPVACPLGDIFCRECALSNILAQKQEIKRAARLREREARDSADLRAQQEAEAHDRAVREFELVQAGLDVPGPASTARKRSGDGDAGRLPSPPPPRRRRTLTSAESPGAGKSGGGGGGGGGGEGDDEGNGARQKKRKFDLDDDELERIAAEDRARARRALDSEKKAAGRPALPSFWAPGVTPTSNSNDVLHEVKRAFKTQPVCPSSQEHNPHPYSLHTLVSIRFTVDCGGQPEEEEEEEEDDDEHGHEASKKTRRGTHEKTQRICPACQKALSNSSKAVLAKPCGHVLCGGCVARFMKRPAGNGVDGDHDAGGGIRCYVCDADLTNGQAGGGGANGKAKAKRDRDKERIRPGLVELRSEGTGFSAGGANEVKRSGLAFQC